MNETKMANDGTQPKAGMNEGPQLYMKCLKSDVGWWEPGRLYQVTDGDIIRDSDGRDDRRLNWNVDLIMKNHSFEFTPIWLLPDGTELEALE